MILRPRQKIFVKRTISALKKYGNTLGVAPTGAGKTIMLSKVISEWIKENNSKTCVLAHRDELTFQNQEKFSRVDPEINTSIFNASEKSWDGMVTFAMVQTLTRDNNLEKMPVIDLLVIDESHHIVASSYQKIINKAKKNNKNLVVFGVTATPNRSDKKGLKLVFNNVSDQITIDELIKSGHLVPPRTFIIDVGTSDELMAINKSANDFNMAEVELIMNKTKINKSVVKHWEEKSKDRKTVIFCSTINHAESILKEFSDKKILSEIIHGNLSADERKERLDKFTSGNVQVIINIAVLTEGWDYPPVSCIILLRPSSFKSTMIQMIGRGLRTVNPKEYPNIIKTDCIVLDFGTSTLIHGSLEETVDLDGYDKLNENEAPLKECSQCESQVPLATKNCPICGYCFDQKQEQKDEVYSSSNFDMVEINILKKSSFLWINLFDDNSAIFATGFNAWSGIFYFNSLWYSIGGKKQDEPLLILIGEKINCIAASNDWLSENETQDNAIKTNKWLKQDATNKQLKYLPNEYKKDFSITRYRASCLLSFFINKRHIKKIIFNENKAKIT